MCSFIVESMFSISFIARLQNLKNRSKLLRTKELSFPVACAMSMCSQNIFSRVIILYSDILIVFKLS